MEREGKKDSLSVNLNSMVFPTRAYATVHLPCQLFAAVFDPTSSPKTPLTRPR